MVAILALLLPPRRLYHYYGRFDFDGRDIDDLATAGNLIYCRNDASEISPIRAS